MEAATEQNILSFDFSLGEFVGDEKFATCSAPVDGLREQLAKVNTIASRYKNDTGVAPSVIHAHVRAYFIILLCTTVNMTDDERREFIKTKPTSITNAEGTVVTLASVLNDKSFPIPWEIGVKYLIEDKKMSLQHRGLLGALEQAIVGALSKPEQTQPQH